MAAESGSREEGAAAAAVIWSSQALDDVAKIRAYLTTFDPGAANRIAVALVAAGDSLETFPARGTSTPWREARRIVVMRQYLLYYREVAGRVDILHVRHGARRPFHP